jgi:hypothetical protein
VTLVKGILHKKGLRDSCRPPRIVRILKCERFQFLCQNLSESGTSDGREKGGTFEVAPRDLDVGMGSGRNWLASVVWC